MTRLQRLLLAAYVCLGAVVLASDHMFLVVNLTESLPERVFVVVPRTVPERGELIAYRWHGGAGYPAGAVMVKRRAGVPGDAVTVVDRTVHVNGRLLGLAKATSRRGLPLAALSPGVIPPGHSYVAAPHPDSLDSRYALTGLIRDDQVIGRAYALF